MPGFGGQLQPRAILGAQPEAVVSITWAEETVTLPDVEVVRLRSPRITFTVPYAPCLADAHWSPRVAPPVFGLGLLEAITDADITAQADEK